MVNVSVIVTVYNSGDFLYDCLESLRRQTLKSIEVVVVNDGSSDHRDEEIILSFMKTDNRFVYIKNSENRGTGYSRERGVAVAKGQYIGFLDSDDIALSNAYELLFKHAVINSCDISICNYAHGNKFHNNVEEVEHVSSGATEIISGDRLFYLQISRIERPYYLRIDWWNKIYKRELFEENSVSFPYVVRNEGVMSTVMSLLAEKCIIIDHPAFISSLRSDSVCRTFKLKNIEDIIISCDHVYGWYKAVGANKNYGKEILSLFGFIILNHNLKMILRESKEDREKYIPHLLDKIKSNKFGRYCIYNYLTFEERSAERLAYASMNANLRYNALSVIKDTDFHYRKIGGKHFRERSSYMSANVVSIITIVKDLIQGGRKEFFEKMIETVASQTYGRGNIEHVIVDGGSSDGTVEFLTELDEVGAIDRWVSERDSGVYNAMNKGLDYSSGSYVLYLNSDDYLASDAIEELVSAIIKNKSDYSFADAYKIDEHENKVGTHIGDINKVFFGSPYCHQTLLCRRECFSAVRFDESYKITMWQFALDLHLQNFKSAYVSKYLAYFRVGGISTDDRHQEKFKAEQNKIKVALSEVLGFGGVDEYEFLNHLIRRWDVSNFAEVNVDLVFSKIKEMDTGLPAMFNRSFCALIDQPEIRSRMPGHIEKSLIREGLIAVN